MYLTLYSIELILTHQQETAFENIVGNEEIAHNEQFLLFPQSFLLNQKIVSPFVNLFDIISSWVPRGSVVKCLTRNPGVLGSSLTGSSGFSLGSVLGQDTSEPSLVLVKHRKA